MEESTLKSNPFAFFLRTLAASVALGGAAILAPNVAFADGGESGDGQAATQTSEGGDQTIGEQSNSSTVTQAQGNGNLNLSPALTLLDGEAGTGNYQGNGNDADATVVEGNAATQDQTAQQGQAVTQTAGSGDGCCASSGDQQVTQESEGGHQSIGEQSNTSEVNQYQGNGNINISPAITVLGGEAETSNYQGNHNEADATVVQGNTASQEQTSTQSQAVDQDASAGSSCCHSGGDQEVSQESKGGDQYIGEQSNDSTVTQKQGNGNINISPAITLLGGDAETSNYQGNHNDANATVVQGDAASQEQTSTQDQYVIQTSGSGDGCCGGSGDQAVEQKSEGGDQSIDKQSNSSDVSQWQGNGNINISPAIAIFGGEAETKNSQGNYNDADATVVQGNVASQDQTSTQDQAVIQVAESACGCEANHSYNSERSLCCGGGVDQSVSQSAYGGDQHIGEQKNYSDVTQKQGNGNLNISPAVAIGSLGRIPVDGMNSCYSGCGEHQGDEGGTTTRNAQGNGNDADALVLQKNIASQDQSSNQDQTVIQVAEGSQGCGCEAPKYSRSMDGKGEDGQSVSQVASGGDQSIDKQKNGSDVTQKQGNFNGNVSPALTLGSGHANFDGKSGCGCGGAEHEQSGGASTWNSQGNRNDANAFVLQGNWAHQDQTSTQWQHVWQAWLPEGGAE